MSEPLLEVTDLRVDYKTHAGPARVVDGLSFRVEPGETLGIVGESGSGKTMTSMAVLGLLPRAARVTGSVRFEGQELVGLSDRRLRDIRGRRIAMVFQDALAALNPVMTIGDQLTEAVRVHRRQATRRELTARATELLELVGIPSPVRRLAQYPHEFSGGMRQRVMIAMSIANEPRLIIADEPTTALDVTVQAQVLDVLGDVQRRTGAALLLITHDLGVVAGLADRVLVMYGGDQVEQGGVEDIFYTPAHPYTSGLLASLPVMQRRVPGARLHQIAGQPPAPTDLPPGCRFADRCPHVEPGRCDRAKPEPVAVSTTHAARCLRTGEIPHEVTR